MSKVGCVGPASKDAGKAIGCRSCPNQPACAAGAGRAVEDPTPGLVYQRLASVKNVLIVLSGKGGVGKSTVSCQLATALANQGKNVGLLDIDICGPSVPRMLGLTGRGIHQSSTGWTPVFVDAGDGDLSVMSVGFLLPHDDNAVIWRGPRKSGLIKQFLTEVDWGELDFLIIDTPPGTSDEHISVAQYLKLSNVAGAIVVTTPQEVSMQDVRKELNFCVKTKIKVVGVIENMNPLFVPFMHLDFFDRKTGEDRTAEIHRLLESFDPPMRALFDEADASVSVFHASNQSSPKSMAAKFKVPYLGALPLDPALLEACESGKSIVHEFKQAPAFAPLKRLVATLLTILEANKPRIPAQDIQVDPHPREYPDGS